MTMSLPTLASLPSANPASPRASGAQPIAGATSGQDDASFDRTLRETTSDDASTGTTDATQAAASSADATKSAVCDENKQHDEADTDADTDIDAQASADALIATLMSPALSTAQTSAATMAVAADMARTGSTSTSESTKADSSDAAPDSAQASTIEDVASPAAKELTNLLPTLRTDRAASNAKAIPMVATAQPDTSRSATSTSPSATQPLDTSAANTNANAKTTASSESTSGKANDTALNATSTAKPSTDWLGAMASAANTAPQATDNASLKLPPNQPTQWREPMLSALGERVQWQVQGGIEQAVIRLEPPQLGRVDIVIRQEAGALQVHLSATHREVVTQLQGLSDSLRQELAGRHTQDVAVQVSQQSLRDAPNRQRGQQGQGGEQQAQPGRALSDETTANGHAAPLTFAMPTERA